MPNGHPSHGKVAPVIAWISGLLISAVETVAMWVAHLFGIVLGQPLYSLEVILKLIQIGGAAVGLLGGLMFFLNEWTDLKSEGGAGDVIRDLLPFTDPQDDELDR